jgi:hypothetical protein
MKVKWTMRGETDVEVWLFDEDRARGEIERTLNELTPRDFARDAKYIDFEIPNMGTLSIILKDIKWNKEG